MLKLLLFCMLQWIETLFRGVNYRFFDQSESHSVLNHRAIYAIRFMVLVICSKGGSIVNVMIAVTLVQTRSFSFNKGGPVHAQSDNQPSNVSTPGMKK